MGLTSVGTSSLYWTPGGVAQLVERYVRNVEVDGSNPFTSTTTVASSVPGAADVADPGGRVAYSTLTSARRV